MKPWHWSLMWNSLTGVLAGAVVSMLSFELLFLSVFLLPVYAWRILARKSPKLDPAVGWTRRAIRFGCFLITVGVCVVLPVKPQDRLPAAVFEVPRNEITIGELRQSLRTDLYRTTGLRSLRFPFEYEDHVLEFSVSRMTFGEFVSAIESQTGLRHRVQCPCGNGMSILWGCPYLGLEFVVPSPNPDAPHRQRTIDAD